MISENRIHPLLLSGATWGCWCASAGGVVGVSISLYDTIVHDNWMFGHIIPATFGAIVFGIMGGIIGSLLGSLVAWVKLANSRAKPPSS